MKQIREKVFETNSSSSHSITIEPSNDGLYDTIIPDDDGNIILTGGEFGWGIEKHTDALTKANYCGVDNLSNEDNLNILKEVIKKQTGCNEVIIDISEDWKDDNHSYIDHESVGTSHEAFYSKEDLRDFIFSKNSILYIDNDNH